MCLYNTRKVAALCNVSHAALYKHFKSKNVKEEQYTQDIIAMWVMVHGLATMLSNKMFI